MKTKVFLFFFFISTISCWSSTTYLKFNLNTENSINVKEIYVNGIPQIVSQKEKSTVVLSCERVKVGANEIIVLVNIFLGENPVEITFNPMTVTIEATTEKGEQIQLLPQDPEQYVLKKQKQAQNAAKWASILNGISSGLNQLNTNTADYVVQQQQIEKSEAQNQQNLNNKYAEIGKSSNEFMQTTTLSAEKNQLGGKIVFFPEKGKVKGYKSIVVKVTIGDELHTFVFDTSEMKI